MKPLRRDVNRYVRTYQQSVPNEIESRIPPSNCGDDLCGQSLGEDGSVLAIGLLKPHTLCSRLVL